MTVRLLKADEIECRVQQVKEKGCSLLLYKDARCDMRVLDETFGVMGWERRHEIVNGNLFCTVSCYDKEHDRWVSKQDVGTESNTEKEKGQASDAFKRACFNWGIGRELYSSPFIWINLDASEVKNTNGKFSLNFGVEFSVKEIGCDDNREINRLVIVDKKGKERFNLGGSVKTPDKEKHPSEAQQKAFMALAKSKGKHKDDIIEAMKELSFPKSLSLLSMAQYTVLVKTFEKFDDVQK